jgi:hypothetical protein
MEVLGIALLIVGLVGLGTLRRYLRESKVTRMYEMIHMERLKAMEKDIPLPSLGHDDIVQELTSLRAADPPNGNSRGGMVWLRVYSLFLGLVFLFGGLGVLAGLRWVLVPEASELWPLGFIPVMVGLGLLLFHQLTRSYTAHS